MIYQKKSINSIPKDFADARKKYQEVINGNKQMGFALLVDPIQAFSDAKIPLTDNTKKFIRRSNPQFLFGNKRLYEAVKEGKIKIPWIKSIKFHIDK